MATTLRGPLEHGVPDDQSIEEPARRLRQGGNDWADDSAAGGDSMAALKGQRLAMVWTATRLD